MACALAIACAPGGTAAQATAPPDLSNLEFAPSSPAGVTAPDPTTEPEGGDAPGSSAERTGRTMVRLAESIQAEQAIEGTFSPGLIYDMVTLASLYQQIDDHVAAIAVLDRAKQIVRVNNGLSSLDQAEMLQKMIVSLEAMGRFGTAALERNELLSLARRHPTDLRVGAIFALVADGRVAAIERWLDAEMKIRPIIYGSGPSGRDDRFENTVALVRSGMTSAQQSYGEAIRATGINGSPGGPDLYEIEADLMKTYWMQAANMRLFFDSATSRHEIRESLDEIGEKSYERRVVYSEALLRPPTEVASALIELGDWHLLFRKDHEADSAYRRALDTLKRAGMPAEQIDSLFTPSTEPMLIPVFAPRLIGEGQAPAYMGYVDVAVDLNAYGRSEDVLVTSQSGPTTKTIVRRLKKYISKNQFRPLFVNGERVENHDVALRYYFRY